MKTSADRRYRSQLCAAVMLTALCGGLVAQRSGEVAAPGVFDVFDDAYAAAEALRQAGDSDLEAQRAAYTKAAEAFAIIDREMDGYVGYLPAAGYAATWAQQHARAATWFGDAMQRGAPSAWLVEQWIRSLADDGRPLEALACARNHRGDWPRAVAMAGLPLATAAAFALRQGRTDEGLDCFEAAAVHSERDPLALANLALAYRSVGKVAAAEAAYLEALEKAPDDSLLWNDFGLFCKGLGRREQALRAFKKSLALESEPKDGPATGNLADLALAGVDVGVEKPILAVTRVLQSFPDSAMSRRRCIDAFVGRRP